MKAIIVLITLAMATVCYADNNIRIGGSWDVSPHSDGSDRLSDGKMVMLGYERDMLTINNHFRVDGGVWLHYLWHDTMREDCSNNKRQVPGVACVQPPPEYITDRQCSDQDGDGWGLNSQLIIKPTVTVWRIDLWGAVGAGPDYQDTDGWDGSVSYAYGADVGITDAVSIGVWAQEIFRADGGEYRVPIAVGLRIGW